MLVSLKTSLEKMLVISLIWYIYFEYQFKKLGLIFEITNLTDFAIRTKINVEENRTRDIVNLF